MTGGWTLVAHARNPRDRTLTVVGGAGPPARLALSARELEAAALRAQGFPLKKLANDDRRSASLSAASHLVTAARRKLGLRTEADLVGFFLSWPDEVTAMVARPDARPILCITYPANPWSLPGCLSGAERRILERMLEGMSYGAIARACGVARSTVANQIASVHQKLGVHSRLELIVVLRRPRSERRRATAPPGESGQLQSAR